METKESIAIEALRNILSPITYLENQAKAEGNRKGKQFVSQPKSIKQKTKRHR